jgi:hypothetical protein
MANFHLDRTLTEAFVTGRLDPQGQATLAEQVARVMPFHAQLPTGIVARLSQIVDHLGGEEALLGWIDSHPGRPRLVARLFVLIGLFDRFSAESAVVKALRELRARTPFPEGLKGYLAPHTDDDTLASLAWEIESLLGDDRADEAVQLALATVAMLQQIAPRAGELDPDLRDMGDLLERARQDILAAAHCE